MAAETDKKIKEIEEHIDNLSLESDEEEKPQEKNMPPKRFVHAWHKDAEENAILDITPQQSEAAETKTRIFSQKLDVAKEQTPAFLKLDIDEKGESVEADDQPRKILIEELDLD